MVDIACPRRTKFNKSVVAHLNDESVLKKVFSISAQHRATEGDVFEIRQPEGFSIGKFVIVAGFGDNIEEEAEILLRNPSRKNSVLPHRRHHASAPPRQ